MDEKEFRKLRKQDFLELLLTQGQELSELQQKYDETLQELELTKESNERIKIRLDEKDALIERLKERLDAKDAEIQRLHERLNSRKIELREAGSIAMAALQLNGIFEAAQKAADQYLENVTKQTDSAPPSPDSENGDVPVQAPVEQELDGDLITDPEEEAAEQDLAEKLELNRQHDLEAKAEEEQEKAAAPAATEEPEAPAESEGQKPGEEKKAESTQAVKKHWWLRK